MITIWFNSVYGPSERTDEGGEEKEEEQAGRQGILRWKRTPFSASLILWYVSSGESSALPSTPSLFLDAMRPRKHLIPKYFKIWNIKSRSKWIYSSLFRTWDASSPLPSLSFHAACSPNLPYTQRKGASIIILQEAVVVVDQIIKEHAFDVSSSSSSSLSSPSSTRPKTLAPYDRPPCFNVNKTPESSSLSDWLTGWWFCVWIRIFQQNDQAGVALNWNTFCFLHVKSS